MAKASGSNVPLPEVVSAKPTDLDARRKDLQGDGISDQVLGHVDIVSKSIAVLGLSHNEAVSDSIAVPQADLQPLEDRGAGPWMLVARKRKTNKGKAKENLGNSMPMSAAKGRLGLTHGVVGGGKPNKNDDKFLPLYNSHKAQDGNIFGHCPPQGTNSFASHQSFKVLQVQDHVESRQPVFGGFTSMPSSGTVKLDVQHDETRVDVNGIVVPPASHSHCSLELVVGSGTPPMTSMGVDGNSSTELGLDSSSSPHAALVPYINQDASDRTRCGTKSLKMERMLNDLGPVSLTPRKRRLIVINYDGGVASPSSPE